MSTNPVVMIGTESFVTACDALASTTDASQINEAVYGTNRFAHVCVMENPLLSAAQLNHLLKVLESPEDRVALLSHPNYSRG